MTATSLFSDFLYNMIYHQSYHLRIVGSIFSETVSYGGLAYRICLRSSRVTKLTSSKIPAVRLKKLRWKTVIGCGAEMLLSSFIRNSLRTLAFVLVDGPKIMLQCCWSAPGTKVLVYIV